MSSVGEWGWARRNRWIELPVPCSYRSWLKRYRSPVISLLCHSSLFFNPLHHFRWKPFWFSFCFRPQWCAFVWLVLPVKLVRILCDTELLLGRYHWAYLVLLSLNKGRRIFTDKCYQICFMRLLFCNKQTVNRFINNSNLSPADCRLFDRMLSLQCVYL